MVMQGVPEPEIVRTITSAPRVAFDLEPDIVRELQRAGVSERIVAAMRSRLPEATPAPAGSASNLAKGLLEIRLASGSPGAKAVAPVAFEVIRKTPRWAANEMGMLQRSPVEDLAFFALCSSPEHVPDHWQDQTELKDFVRHQKLLFRAGSRPGKSHGFEVMALNLPDTLTLEIPEGTHRLVVGVAAKAGPEWHVLGSDERRDVAIQSGHRATLPVTLSSRVVGTRMIGFKEDQIVAIGELVAPGGTP